MRSDDKPDVQMSRYRSPYLGSRWARQVGLSVKTTKTHNQILKKHASAKRRRRDRREAQQ